MPTLHAPKLALTLAAWLSLTATTARCLAQDNITAPDGPGAMPGAEAGGMPGQVNILMVLMTPAVQEELKLDEAQKTRVFELARDAGRKSREIMQAALASGGNSNPQVVMMAAAKIRQENERAAGKVLQGKQKERVEQIMLRVDGPLAVARPEIASKIGLSKSQNQKVQGVMQQMAMAQRELFISARMAAGGEPVKPAALRPGLGKIRSATTKQLGRVLNAQQRDAFDALLGEPFDISKIDPGLARAPANNNDDDPADPARPRAKRKGAAPSKKPSARPKADPDPAGDESASKPKP